MAKLGTTSYKQTRFGILPRDAVLKLEVKGTKKGLLLLQQLAQQQEKLSIDLIKKIHKESFDPALPDEAGNFRTIQVTYSSREAPHFSKIYEMMKILTDDTEYALVHLPNPTDDNAFITKLVEMLAHFQHRFVFIHPFKDYNGRTARLFTNYILMRINLPIIEITVENNQDRELYIKALQGADKGDYENLELIISTSLNESLEKISQ